MKAHWRERWIDALRSGRYERTSGSLCIAYGATYRFCALGVLADVMAPQRWQPRRGGLWGIVPLDGYTTALPADMMDAAGLTVYEAGVIASMSDSGASFSQIALLIETTIPLDDARVPTNFRHLAAPAPHLDMAFLVPPPRWLTQLAQKQEAALETAVT